MMQTDYYRKLNIPSLTKEEQELILSRYYKNIENVICTCVRDDNTVYNDIEKQSLDKKRIPGFNMLIEQHDTTIIDILSKRNINFQLGFIPGIQGIVEQQNVVPHSDNDRTVNVICYITGSADTVFYESKNYSQGKVYDSSSIKEVERVNLNLNEWYALNTKAIHSVENIKGNRVGISLSILNTEESFTDYCDFLESKLIP